MMQLFTAVFILFTLFHNIATDVNVPIVVVNQKLIAHGQTTSVSLPEHLLKSEYEKNPAILEAVHAALRNALGFYGQVSLKFEKNAAKEITKINVTTPYPDDKKVKGDSEKPIKNIEICDRDNGDCLTVILSPHHTVMNVKNLINAKRGTKQESQKLYYNGSLLHDDNEKLYGKVRDGARLGLTVVQPVVKAEPKKEPRTVNVPIVVVNQKLIAHGQTTSVSLPEHLLKSEYETDPAILEAVHAALRNALGFYGQVSLKFEKNAAKEITKINVTTPFKAEKNDV